MGPDHEPQQHHVQVLADDAHFRHANANRQASHETISLPDFWTLGLSLTQTDHLSPCSEKHWMIKDTILLFNKYRRPLTYFQYHPPPPPLSTNFNNCMGKNKGLIWEQYWIFSLCVEMGKQMTRYARVFTSYCLMKPFAEVTTSTFLQDSCIRLSALCCHWLDTRHDETPQWHRNH